MQFEFSAGKWTEERPTDWPGSGSHEARGSGVPTGQPPTPPELNPKKQNTSHKSPPPLPKSFKAKHYWKEVRLSKRRLSRAVISEVTEEFPSDIRPHVIVSLSGLHIRGLLDSGASISCLGCNALQRIELLGLKLKTVSKSVHTADGTAQPVVGFVDINIEFQNKSRKIRLFVIPSLTQELYLGMDFWEKFGLAPVMVEELNQIKDNEGQGNPPTSAHELSDEQQVELEAVKQAFLSSDQAGLGKTEVLKHCIDVGNSTPIKQRHHFVSPAIQEALNSEVDLMLARGVIEESKSAWSSPVLLVKKANGKRRFCLDCRAVNNVTKKDAYPMPIIDGILASLNETVFISSIDLKDAFWQIELDADSRDKTAFTIPGRPLYQFVRMPFGLCNAPQTMCRLMDKVIPAELREFVFVYIDDLLVVSKCFESHISRLKIVAKCLRDANLTINVTKSKFVMKEIRYLGHIVGNGQIKPDPGKVEAIQEFPVPRTTRQIRRFLGLCGWYRRYIAGFAAIAAPITDLLGKTSKFTWTNEAQVAFNKLKECLTSAPVLSHPDFSKPFVIQCDASNMGVGGVLYQLDNQGEEHPIAYMSQKLNSAQRNYSVTEQECLAAILSLKKFRGYIEGMKFTIVTDHASLKWLMTQKDLSGRLARWSLKLQAFDFSIEHRKGSANVVPDALSRVFLEEIISSNTPGPIDLNHPEFQSTDYMALKRRIVDNQPRLPDLQIRGQHVYVRTQPRKGDVMADTYCWKLWVPSGLTETVISNAHDPALASHPGVGKTIEKVKRLFFWPKMCSEIVEFIRRCQLCKETKAPNITLKPQMGSQVTVSRPWQRLYIDLLGPYPRSKAGNSTLLIVLDQFSKFVLLKPLRKASAAEVTRFLEQNVYHMFGVPESIWSDNGVQFISKEFKNMNDRYGVTHIRTATHSPQSNASERVNRSILAAIRSYVTQDQQTWDAEISSIGSALRNNVHESTGYSPHYLVFGQRFINHGSCYRLLRELEALPESDIDVLPPTDFRMLVSDRVRTNLNAAYERHKKAYNARSRLVNFSVGQEVYRRNFQLSNFSKGLNAKLGKQWVKARVLRQLGKCMYELEDMSGHKLNLPYHAKDLKQ